MKTLVLIILVFSVLLFGCTQIKTDPKACEKVPPEYSQKNQCYREVAKNLKDPSVCANIDDQVLRDYWCYREIAYDTNNSAVCNQITDSDAKQSCLNVLSGKQPFERGR